MERKEAIEIARKLYNEPLFSKKDKEAMVTLIPELKESEDEKIRYSIVSLIKFSLEDGSAVAPGQNTTKEEALAWLEKQGEQMSDPRYSILDKLIKADNIYQMSVNDTMVEEAKNKAIEALSKLEISKLLGLEKQGEQKPADRAEPKFKVGDYIISNNNSEIIYHITGTSINELGNSDYVCEHVGREKEYNGRIYNMSQDKVDANFRLWTIQDAKNGDVLSYNDSKNNVWVCIFKEYANERVYDYCTLDKESFWERGNWNYLASFSYTPATKEQCDLLFKRMGEAGYGWDSEKKELKKIEQKPTECKLRGEMLDFAIRAIELCKQYAINNKVNGYNVLPDVPEKYQELIDWLKSFRSQPKQEWSEEDEDALDMCLDVIPKKWKTKSGILLTKWLKDKICPQQKVEWSKEEEKYLDAIEKLIMDSRHTGYNGVSRKDAVDWIKSFRPQRQWKPSTDAFIDDFIEKTWDWIEDNILSSNQQDKSSLYCEQFRNYIRGI